MTTTVDAVQSKPEQDIFIRSRENLPLDELWNVHLDGIQRMQNRRKTTPVDHRSFSDAAQFLEQIDSLFVRFLELDD